MMKESHSEEESKLHETMSKIRHHLDSIITFLNPLLPLANCHMVEFFTHNHWDNLIPRNLKSSLDSLGLNEAVIKFWTLAEKDDTHDDSELGKWIQKARSNCIAVNNEYCISPEQFQVKIKSWGGEIKPEIKVKEFMNNKKSYEVQTMSRLVASLHQACATSCCVEAGGGRGHLPVALSLGYGVPSLTIDCDEKSLTSGMGRVKIIQKQWHAIAKRVKDGCEEKVAKESNTNLHRFASAYVTRHTDLVTIVREKFPEMEQQDVKLLLTGLHTCGNLGPDSLRIFRAQPATAAVFNVPCCYHLLTEETDSELFDVFQKDYGFTQEGQGFPMSEHLKGYNLGRNARMLAAQSIDRVVSQRQLPAKSLLYRALLQVLIKRHLPDFPLSDGKLKRLSKYEDFQQYFKMADETLNLNLFDKLPDSYVSDFCKDMDSQWKDMVLFYLLRLCLAQVVESVILLDRLLYLYESGFQNVYLVKLFDPVLSPRCHSIVAVR
ncbi:hypothetical protein ABMA27_003786 [Loxostege sticticalis]|uniref:Methyltransferase domain-containing protein n=1 Tax=Loxostege sticticalis TaxID=481309 RepID=A0ABR3HQB1_LOXSC